MPQTEVRPKVLEDLGIERKPFYRPSEVARITGMGEQSILDRIHLPAEHPQYLYAIALGQRTYRIPVGALAQLVGIPARITRGKEPRRTSEATRDERTRVAAASKKLTRSK